MRNSRPSLSWRSTVVTCGAALVVQRVDEERPAGWLQAAPDQIPEGIESVQWHVRETEAEEHHVIRVSGLPFKEVGLDALQVRMLDAGGVDGHDFGRAIDQRQRVGVAGELLRPQAGAAGELEDAATWAKLG